MSTGFSQLTITGALQAAKPFVGPFQIVGTSPEQRELVEELPAYTEALSPYRNYTQGFAARSAAEINADLERRGFDIRLAEWTPSPLRFGVAGVTDVTVSWHTPGKVVEIEAPNGRYPGFALDPEQMARVVQVDGFREPMVQVRTKENLELRLVMTEAPSSQLDLMRQARRLHRAEVNPMREVECSAVHLPMVRLAQRPDISWLIGLTLQGSEGPGWQVQQAEQEVRFAMNQFGARAKEATAFGLERMMMSFAGPYVVNRSFLVVLGQPDQVEVPVFGAYVTPHDWKNPGDLSAL